MNFLFTPPGSVVKWDLEFFVKSEKVSTFVQSKLLLLCSEDVALKEAGWMPRF